MFEWLFGKKISLECCYCGKVMRVPEDAAQCPHCNEEIPPQYMEFHAQANPFYVPLVGWTSVGKTVWLLALTRRLRELPSTIWPGFVSIPANAPTMEYQQNVEKNIRSNTVPASTPLGVDKAYVQVLRKMPIWGNRTFVIRDCGGENFESFEIYEEQIPFLQKSRTTFFFISFPDIWEDEKKSADDLLNCYLNSLGRICKLRQERRKIVVVLSKADAMSGTLPENVYHYLIDDPMVHLSKEMRHVDFTATMMCEYIEQMKNVSDEIKAWLSNIRDGKQFIAIAREYNIELRFSAMSALGSHANNGVLQKPWEPYRVLDPFFWALEFHSDLKTE